MTDGSSSTSKILGRRSPMRETGGLLGGMFQEYCKSRATARSWDLRDFYSAVVELLRCRGPWVWSRCHGRTRDRHASQNRRNAARRHEHRAFLVLASAG